MGGRVGAGVGCIVARYNFFSLCAIPNYPVPLVNIAPGTRLGPYEIVSPVGAGGMGEVWRARDTRLDRSVAIKVLPQELAANAQFRVRFEREAKAISQLNHPNICTLHDVGEDHGTSYLVMELLDGETLADRLARGPLPLAEVLRYGIQIADGLDRAHRAGIVHRDLKPGNVICTAGRASPRRRHRRRGVFRAFWRGMSEQRRRRNCRCGCRCPRA